MIFIQVTSSAGVTIGPAMIGEIDATILQTQITAHATEFVGGMPFIVISSETQLNAFVSAEDTIDLTFDVPVTSLAILELQASIETQLELRTGILLLTVL